MTVEDVSMNAMVSGMNQERRDFTLEFVLGLLGRRQQKYRWYLNTEVKMGVRQSANRHAEPFPNVLCSHGDVTEVVGHFIVMNLSVGGRRRRVGERARPRASGIGLTWTDRSRSAEPRSLRGSGKRRAGGLGCRTAGHQILILGMLPTYRLLAADRVLHRLSITDPKIPLSECIDAKQV